MKKKCIKIECERPEKIGAFLNLHKIIKFDIWKMASQWMKRKSWKMKKCGLQQIEGILGIKIKIWQKYFHKFGECKHLGKCENLDEQ